MARGNYTRYAKWRGEGLRGEYQSNAQVPQEPDVASAVDHVAPKKAHPRQSLFPGYDDWRDKQYTRLFPEYA
jgi:hypothetical protein